MEIGRSRGDDDEKNNDDGREADKDFLDHRICIGVFVDVVRFLKLASIWSRGPFRPLNDMTNILAAVGQLIGNFFAQRLFPLH